MIETIDSPAEFERLGDDWNSLLRSSASDGLFLTWEWLHTWWSHFSQNKKLCLLAVRSQGADGALLALAPLCQVSRSFPWFSPRWLRFLGAGSVGSDYLDLILRSGMEREILPVLAGHLTRKKGLLELAQVRRHGCQSAALAAEWTRSGGHVREVETNVCPTISLEGHTWDSYLATLGSEHRYNFRRKLKQLHARFAVSFDPVRTEHERREALSHLFSLHALRWESRGGSDGLHTPRLLAFHEDFTRLALERGWLRLFTLRLDGKPAASLYGFRYGRVFYFYQSGLDPAYSRYSVGLVAMGLAIQSALEEGAGEYDLLHGAEPYKFHWASETRPLARLELYPPGTAGRIWNAARTGNRSLRRVARQVLPQTLRNWIAATTAREA